MAAPELEDGQYAIGDLVIGRGTPFPVSSVDWGAQKMTVQDYARPRLDGIAFGRDTRQGSTITFDVGVLPMNGKDVFENLEDLQRQWENAVSIFNGGHKDRFTPGAAAELRYRRMGVERVVYGRTRKFSPIVPSSTPEFCQAVAEFKQMDGNSYSYEVHKNIVSIVPPSSGGLVSPLIGPLTTLHYTSRPGRIFVAGGQPTWLRSIIHGPIRRPSIQITGEWNITLDLNLEAGEYVEIHPYPNERFVRKNGYLNVAGAFTTDSPTLTQMVVPPGDQEIILTGIDPTGTAYLEVFWRDRYSSV